MVEQKIYHLSHIDGDGYGCNVVMDFFKNQKDSKCFGFSMDNIKSYSTNYGYLEKQILNIIEEMKKEPFEKEKLLLITDVNLKDEAFAKKLPELLKEVNAKVQLIDHHKTGEKIAEQNEWYYLEESNCATKNLLVKLKEENPHINTKDIEPLAEMIDNYDRYDEPLSENWLKGSLYQDLAFDIARLYNSNELVRPMEKGELDKKGLEKFLKLDSLKIEAITRVYKKVYEQMQKGKNVVEIMTLGIYDILEEELEIIISKEKDEPKIKEIEKIKSRKDLNIREKIIVVNQMINGFENKTAKRLEGQTDINMKKNMFIFLQNILPKEANPELFEKIQKDIIQPIISNEELSKQEKEIEATQVVYSYIRECVAFDVFGNHNKEFYTNPNIPLNLLSPLSFGEESIERLTHTNEKVRGLNTNVRIIFDGQSGFFQHASYIYNKNLKTNDVLVNFNSKYGRASVRSANQKSSILCEVFEGGGHEDAGGFSLDYSVILTKEEIETLEGKDKTKKEEVQNKISKYIISSVNKTHPLKEEVQNNIPKENVF